MCGWFMHDTGKSVGESMYAQYVCVGYICPARVELQIDIM